jgi:hypothetical protein
MRMPDLRHAPFQGAACLVSCHGAFRIIAFESGRLMHAQIMFLKSADLLPFRSSVNAVVESRHAQVRKLWADMLSSIGVERGIDR